MTVTVTTVTVTVTGGTMTATVTVTVTHCARHISGYILDLVTDDLPCDACHSAAKAAFVHVPEACQELIMMVVAYIMVTYVH
jgi:hypothetical protein